MLLQLPMPRSRYECRNSQLTRTTMELLHVEDAVLEEDRCQDDQPQIEDRLLRLGRSLAEADWPLVSSLLSAVAGEDLPWL